MVILANEQMSQHSIYFPLLACVFDSNGDTLYEVILHTSRKADKDIADKGVRMSTQRIMTCTRLVFFSLLIAFLATVMVSFTVVQEHIAYATATQKCGQWNVVPSPNTEQSERTFYKVATVSANDIWAVGDTAVKGLPYTQTLTEHWNGKNWTVIPTSTNPLTYRTLYGVAAVSTSDVWAVGQEFGPNSQIYQPIIEHWDGTKWSNVASPNPGAGAGGLTGIAVISASDIWAVGSYVLAGPPYGSQALIVHWNGSQWNLVPSPTNVTGTALNSVIALSTNNVWAVGLHDSQDFKNSYSLVEHWDGSRWSVVPSPNPSSSHYKINSIILQGIAASSATDIWAVGNYANYNSKKPFSFALIEHWNGTKWSIVPGAPTKALYTSLSDVAVLSSNNIWAVGDTGVYEGTTFTEHWDGSTWSMVPSPNPFQLYSRFNAVASVPGSNYVWAVGKSTYTDTINNPFQDALTAYYC